MVDCNIYRYAVSSFDQIQGGSKVSSEATPAYMCAFSSTSDLGINSSANNLNYYFIEKLFLIIKSVYYLSYCSFKYRSKQRQCAHFLASLFSKFSLLFEIVSNSIRMHVLEFVQLNIYSAVPNRFKQRQYMHHLVRLFSNCLVLI